MDQPASPSLEWRGGVPVSTRYGDPYFSLKDGLGEAQHVFLAGNALPERFAPGFHIAELGFGTGLNMLAVWQAWQTSGQTGPLIYTSFERHPMELETMRTSLEVFPEISRHVEQFLTDWQNSPFRLRQKTLHLDVIAGDANQTLANWDGAADAWFLDGFSPAKNPELWSESLMKQVANHTNPHGTFATYTAAGKVRRNLERAGFDVQRSRGFAGKRHMSGGKL